MNRSAWRAAPALALVAAALAVVGCGTSASTPPVPASTPLTLERFDDASLSFEYPGAWGAATFQVASSFSNVLVSLSTAPMSDPCDRSPGSVACVRSAVSALGPDGILVEWSRDSFPGWTFDPTKGRPMVVGGRRATLERLDAPEGPCQAIRGERELLVTIDDPTPDMNWTGMRACLRGPSLDQLQSQVASMLSTVAWKP